MFLNLNHSTRPDLLSKFIKLEVVVLAVATGPKAKYLSSKFSTTGLRLLKAMCICMLPWLCPMQLTFCPVTLLTQLKKAGRSKSAMCWKLKSQNSLFLSGLYFVWLRECLLPLLFPSQTSQPRLANMKAGALSSSFMIQVSELSSRPCCRNIGLSPSLITVAFLWILQTVKIQPSSVMT